VEERAREYTGTSDGARSWRRRCDKRRLPLNAASCHAHGCDCGYDCGCGSCAIEWTFVVAVVASGALGAPWRASIDAARRRPAPAGSRCTASSWSCGTRYRACWRVLYSSQDRVTTCVSSARASSASGCGLSHLCTWLLLGSGGRC